MRLWKTLVGLFFLLVIISGALRKWVFPGYPTLFLLLKDVVLWGAFALYALRRSPTELPRPLRTTWIPVLLGGYIGIVCLQAFNLHQPALIVSAIGLKAHLAYLPLVVLLPRLISRASEQKMEKFLWGYGICIFLPVMVLSIYQFYQPPTAWINKYVTPNNPIDLLAEGVVRITGTFSYITTFNAYLTFSAYLGGATLLSGVRHGRRSLTVLGSSFLILTAIVLPMTGSRAGILYSAGGVLALLLVTRVKRWGRLALIVAVMVLGVIGVQNRTGGELFVFEGWDLFAERVQRAGSVEGMESRSEQILLGPIERFEDISLLGYGVGSAHQASRRFAGNYGWLPSGYVETPTIRLIQELGILGWLLFLTLKGALLYFAYQTVRRSQNPVELIIGGTAFCVLLSRVYIPAVFNHVMSAIYWGSAGAMLGIWSIQKVRTSVKADVKVER